MIGRDSKGDLEHYGLWPWILGFAMALVIAGLMFGLSTGFR